MVSTGLTKVKEEERHLNDVTCLLYHQDKLYSGADDGKIKVWSSDLKLIKEIDAHQVNVYSIVASGDTLYSCSNDGTLKAWSIDKFELKKTLTAGSEEIIRLCFTDGKLYSGDDKGNILKKLASTPFPYGTSFDNSTKVARFLNYIALNQIKIFAELEEDVYLLFKHPVLVWENNEQVGKYEVVEEVWDLIVSGSLLFTVRNLDVSIIEMRPGGKQYTYLHSINGRSPMQKVGDHFCFMDREGKSINIHEISKSSTFKPMGKIQQAHNMIVNALSCTTEPHPTIFSGGYDKVVKRWDVLSQQCSGSFETDIVISALAANHQGAVYIAGGFGYIAKVVF